MLLQILFYTHHLTTLLFGVFLSAFFLGVNRNWKNIGILLLSALASGLLCLISIFLIGTEFSDEIHTMEPLPWGIMCLAAAQLVK